MAVLGKILVPPLKYSHEVLSGCPCLLNSAIRGQVSIFFEQLAFIVTPSNNKEKNYIECISRQLIWCRF